MRCPILILLLYLSHETFGQQHRFGVLAMGTLASLERAAGTPVSNLGTNAWQRSMTGGIFYQLDAGRFRLSLTPQIAWKGGVDQGSLYRDFRYAEVSLTGGIAVLPRLYVTGGGYTGKIFYFRQRNERYRYAPYNEQADQLFRSTDFGWVFGLQYQISDRWAFTVHGSQGLSDAFKRTKFGAAYHRTLSADLRYALFRSPGGSGQPAEFGVTTGWTRASIEPLNQLFFGNMGNARWRNTANIGLFWRRGFGNIGLRMELLYQERGDMELRTDNNLMSVSRQLRYFELPVTLEQDVAPVRIKGLRVFGGVYGTSLMMFEQHVTLKSGTRYELPEQPTRRSVPIYDVGVQLGVRYQPLRRWAISARHAMSLFPIDYVLVTGPNGYPREGHRYSRWFQVNLEYSIATQKNR